jgi:hypothetical protein
MLDNIERRLTEILQARAEKRKYSLVTDFVEIASRFPDEEPTRNLILNKSNVTAQTEAVLHWQNLLKNIRSKPRALVTSPIKAAMRNGLVTVGMIREATFEKLIHLRNIGETRAIFLKTVFPCHIQ